jgi:hypothetical protein
VTPGKEGARPKEAPGASMLEHREACSPWGTSAGRQSRRQLTATQGNDGVVSREWVLPPQFENGIVPEDLLGNKLGGTPQGKARRGAQRAFHSGLGYPVGPERWQGRPGA